MKKNPNVVERKVHECFFLINTKQNYFNDTCFLYEINQIGSFIWNCLDETFDINQIAEKLSGAINGNVKKEIIIADISEFIAQLFAEGFVTE